VRSGRIIGSYSRGRIYGGNFCKKTAQKFFNDLNLLLIEHLILQVCKLTDQGTTGRKRNLTVPFLVNKSDFAATPRDMAKVKRLAKRIEKFRTRILPARNRLINHLEVGARFVRNRTPSGNVSLISGMRNFRLRKKSPNTAESGDFPLERLSKPLYDAESLIHRGECPLF